MDAFEVKHTGLFSPSNREVLQLGTVDRFAVQGTNLPGKEFGFDWGTAPNVETFLKWLGWPVGDRNHRFNPQNVERDLKLSLDKGYGPNHFHTDTENGYGMGLDMIIMVACEREYGTWIGQDAVPIKCWTLYLVPGDTMHCSPPTFPGIARVVYTWYKNPNMPDENTRRDEFGKRFVA